MVSSQMIVDVLSTTVQLAPPFLFASIGELISEKSGVLDLGVEGMMLTGAMLGFYITFLTGNPWLGILAAIGGGISLSLIHAYMTINLKVQQIVSGIGIWLFGTGLADMLYRALVGGTLHPVIEGFGAVSVPLLSDIPAVGTILFEQNVLVYIAFLCPLLAWLLLNKTKFGLKIKTSGEKPEVLASLGGNVHRTRYYCVLIGGALAGLAGSYLSTAYLGSYTTGMTAGRGWIAIAIVYFARWKPAGVLGGSLILGGSEAVASRLQGLSTGVPYQFLLMLPYIIIIIALIGMSRGARGPSALTVPFYEPGE